MIISRKSSQFLSLCSTLLSTLQKCRTSYIGMYSVEQRLKGFQTTEFRPLPLNHGTGADEQTTRGLDYEKPTRKGWSSPTCRLNWNVEIPATKLDTPWTHGEFYLKIFVLKRRRWNGHGWTTRRNWRKKARPFRSEERKGSKRQRQETREKGERRHERASWKGRRDANDSERRRTKLQMPIGDTQRDGTVVRRVVYARCVSNGEMPLRQARKKRRKEGRKEKKNKRKKQERETWKRVERAEKG